MGADAVTPPMIKGRYGIHPPEIGSNNDGIYALTFRTFIFIVTIKSDSFVA